MSIFLTAKLNTIIESENEELQNYEMQQMENENDQFEEPDEEAEIIEEKVIHEDHEQLVVQPDGTETPDIDDETKMEILQRMQEEQEAISRRIIRRKKSKKKKKTRPGTAKYTHGMMNRDKRYVRPSTAVSRTTKKKKKKAKKRGTHDKYLDQLRQQQVLQQLAMEQQQMRDQQVEDENDEQIQITPEQAILLYQQLAERHQNGEELTEEEIEQFQSLHQLLQQNLVQEQPDLGVDEPVYSYPVSHTGKRKKSKKKKKKGKKAKQQIDEDALLMMIQKQQNMQYPQPNIELPEGVDEIQEVDEEDTPIRELREQEDAEMEQYQQNNLGRAVHETDIPNQINAQVPANFGVEGENQESEDSKESPLTYYPQQYLNPVDQENIPVGSELTPEQLYQFQQMQAQNQYPDEMSETSTKFEKDPAQNMELVKTILDLGARSGVFKQNLLSILPLSESVANAKKQYKTMKNYKLDTHDKKLQAELAKAKNAKDSKEYFQQILRHR